ncbi:MAG TPA: hypothetical protein VFB84_04635 [Micromonosporaceae bacterium]|nr:hypothetical protein [Micromonosporaceae bacterium]
MGIAAVPWSVVEAIGALTASIFTGLGLVLAILTIRFESRRWRAEVRRLDDERRDALAAQATLVVVTANRSTLGSGKATLVLRNFSQRPVLDVHVRPTFNGEVVDPESLAIQPVLAPDSEQEIVVDAPYGREPLVAAEVQLRDSMGLCWRRTDNGPPERLAGEIR